MSKATRKMLRRRAVADDNRRVLARAHARREWTFRDGDTQRYTSAEFFDGRFFSREQPPIAFPVQPEEYARTYAVTLGFLLGSKEVRLKPPRFGRHGGGRSAWLRWRRTWSNNRNKF